LLSREFIVLKTDNMEVTLFIYRQKKIDGKEYIALTELEDEDITPEDFYVLEVKYPAEGEMELLEIPTEEIDRICNQLFYEGSDK